MLTADCKILASEMKFNQPNKGPIEMKITIEVDSIAEFNDVIAHLANKTAAAAAVVSSPKTEIERVKSAKVEETKSEKPEPEKAKSEKAKEPETSDVSYAKDVAPRVLKMAEAKGRDATVALLQTFGVDKAPQLKADQYAAVVKALDAALEA